MILDLLLITVITCYMVDISGIVDSLKTPVAYLISKYYKINIDPEFVNIPKPFSCSLCMTFWMCLAYVLMNGELSLYTLCLCSLMSMFARNVTGFLSWLSEALVWIENKLFLLVH